MKARCHVCLERERDVVGTLCKPCGAALWRSSIPTEEWAARRARMYERRRTAKLRADFARVQEAREREDESGERTSGILAEVCDIAFGDSERAATHGYEGIKERVTSLVRRAKRAGKGRR